jgi:hypothetical protein
MAKRTGGRSLEGNSGDLTPALILPFSMPRRFGNPEGERARKAATARIRRITDARPELGAHLDRTIRTGTTCRYEPHPNRALTVISAW